MATPPSQLSFFPDEWPDELTYLENYIQEDEADRLVQDIDAAPWRTDLKRRVQNCGYRYDYKARQARKEDYLGPLPEFFQQLAEPLTAEGHFHAIPDQVIVNEYQPGQGISAHIDCLLVMAGEARHDWTHAIPAKKWLLPRAESPNERGAFR